VRLRGDWLTARQQDAVHDAIIGRHSVRGKVAAHKPHAATPVVVARVIKVKRKVIDIAQA